MFKSKYLSIIEITTNRFRGDEPIWNGSNLKIAIAIFTA